MSFLDSAAIASRRQRQVQRVLYVTLGLNVLVFLIKLILGLTTGSLSLGWVICWQVASSR